MHGVSDILFSNVSLTGLAAAMVFGVVVVSIELHKLSRRLEELAAFQKEIAAKLEELEARVNSGDRF